jgi:iron complex transport system ATP-binding protein
MTPWRRHRRPLPVALLIAVLAIAKAEARTVTDSAGRKVEVPDSVGNRVALLDTGRLIAQGAPAEVLTPERLRAVYGVSVIVERLSQGQTVCAPDYGAQ